MSSVTRFLRQIPTGVNTYSEDLNNLYYLVPGSGNYVGNYPNSPYSTVPGYLVKTTAVGAAKPGSGSAVVRDMGKTVFAAVSAAGTGADLANTAPGFFRAVQVVNPVAVPTPTSSTNFGVNGSSAGSLPAGNAGDMGYNTFYVPIVVDGRLASSASGIVAPFAGSLHLAGQM